MRCAALLLLGLLASCSAPDVSRFAVQGPAFDPLGFFTGHARSWGVLENRSGAPTEWIRTDCVGHVEPDGSLTMIQHLTQQDGTTQERDWHMRRVAPGRFAATASDMVGTAHGKAAGRVFHWDWVLASAPGNPLLNVTLSQWMYLERDGTMVNRTVISKLGITLAQVTEQFQRVK